MKQTFVKILGSLIVVFIIGLVIYHMQQNVQAISANQYTCQSDGTYATVTSGPGALTGIDATHSAQAMSWLTSMTKTRTVVKTDSTVTPSIEYASSYMGSISGTFHLSGASYPTKNDASIQVDSPTTVADDYAGAVSGKVLTTPESGRWIIQVYKLTSSGEVQVAKQALADATTGNFSIDLSTIASPPVGKWEFGILDANNGYAPYGTKWPSVSYYNGLEVQQKLVTDTVYDWSTTKALTDNTFTFLGSNTGKKLFRLVDTATGDILAEHVIATGLIRSFQLDPSDPSYGTAFEDQSYVYDQALALFAALGTDNQSLADMLADGLLNFQVTSGPLSGGFVFAAPQLSPTYRDAQIRTGAHAIATDALLSYINKYPNATNIVADTAAAHNALNFIDGTLSSAGTTSGLYLGGYGDYSGPSNTFAPDVVIQWASTEHNIDVWNTFEKAAKVFGYPTDYTQKAATLNQVIISKLYSPTGQRYYQGMQPSGADTADPLDVNTWGAMQMYSSGRYDQALQTLNRLQPFTFTSQGVTGYAPFYDSAGYPGAVPTVWFEGSFGGALAQYHVGNYDAYRTLIDQLIPGQQSDGSFQYATDQDSTYSISKRKSVASTAWYVLATTGRSAIWNICQYNPPVDPIASPSTPPSSTGGSASNSSTTKTIAIGSDNQDMTTTETTTTPKEDTVTTTGGTSVITNDTTMGQPVTKNTFLWTPIVIAGSSVAGVGILWLIIALIRSRILLG